MGALSEATPQGVASSHVVVPPRRSSERRNESQV